MQKYLAALLCLILPGLLAAKTDPKKNFIQGDPGIKSINALSFGPEGILFIGDSKNAMVYALDTKDTEESNAPDRTNISGVDKAIAEKLGTEASKLVFQDMVVNPLSKNIYLAIHHEDGTPVLMRYNGKQELEWIPLDDVSYSKKAIAGAVGAEEKDRRGRELRKWAVSQMHYSNGSLMLTGLSNKEFKSTFRKMAFPFQDGQTDASLEIYHAAHGRYETYAPIKSFTTAEVNGEAHVIAGYTCTPLVVFPESDLKSGQHVKGRTVAEMGSWNTPVDMVVVEKDGEKALLIANTNRAVMKVKFSDIEAYEGSLTTPVEESFGTEGVHFVNMPWVNVLQMDKMGDEQVLLLKRQVSGDLVLTSQGKRWF